MRDDAKRFFEKYEKQTNIYLNDIQKRAVLTDKGPLLLLATPGSGKTTTLVMRIGYLIEVKGVSPHKIVAVTFSKSQAIDMEERFRKIFPMYQQVTFSTIHRLAFQVVRQEYSRIGQAFQLIEGRVEQWHLHKKNIIRHLYEEVHKEKMTEDQVEEFSSFVSYVKNKRLKEEEIEKLDIQVPEAKKLYYKYEQFKENHHHKQLLDFDDMLTKANEILKQNPAMRESFGHRYDYVLTDESQDTSFIQHALIEKLAEQHENLCIVADDDQSIYSWRAAEPNYLLNLKDVYPHVNILTMEQNYRSSQEIVKLSNAFIKRNKHRYEKEMFTKNQPVEQVNFTLFADYADQAEAVIKEVKKQVHFRDSAILFRNNFSAIPFVDALEKEHIPFVMHGHDERFFSHWVVQDILNIFRLSYDPTRVDIFEKIYTKFHTYIDKRLLQKLQIQSNQSVFIQLSELTNKEREKKRFLKIDEQLMQLKSMSPLHALRKVRYDLGYFDHLQQMSARLGFHLDTLLERLHTLEIIAQSEATIVSFAKRLKQLEETIQSASFHERDDAIALLTIHRSKGMEFTHVYMVDLIEGVLPAKTDETDILIEEAARLFYVGLTRAKMHLHLYAYRRKFHKDTVESRFFREAYRLVHKKNPNSPLDIPIVGKSSLKKSMPSSKNEKALSNAVQSREELKEGIMINHYVFGIGQIKRLEADVMLVQFSREEKMLQIDLSIERGVIAIEET